MEDGIRTILFSTLYPSSARPRHGLFVETRLRKLLESECLETEVIAPVPWFPSSDERFGRYADFAKTPLREVRHNINIRHPRYLLPPGIGMNLAPVLLALGARKSVADLLGRGFEFDLIDAHYFYPDGVAAALLGRWFGKPTVITARGSDVNLIANFAVASRWIRWAHRRSAATIAVSDALKRKIERLSRIDDKTRVIRNGVDMRAFPALDREECKAQTGLGQGDWLLFVGRLTREKGVCDAIRALGSLDESIGLAIVGAGDGDEGSRLARLCEELGVTGRVRFAGARPQEELPVWYSAARVLLLPSENEGLPNVILESLSCGTPVVATDVGGIPEIVNADIAGRLVKHGSVQALSEAVKELLAADYPQLRVRGHVRDFGWSAATERQLQIFSSIKATSDGTRPAKNR